MKLHDGWFAVDDGHSPELIALRAPRVTRRHSVKGSRCGIGPGSATSRRSRPRRAPTRRRARSPTMRLFKRRLPTSAPSVEVAGLEQVAATRGWRAVERPSLGSTLDDRIFVANFSLYDRRKPLSSNDPAEVRIGHYRNSYEGEVDGRRLAVANHSTNVAQLRIYEWKAVSVCAWQLGTLCPVVVIQPRSLPRVVAHVPETQTGNPEFDARFVTFGLPGIGPGILTGDVQQRIMARDDWLFLGDDDWFVCVGRDPFHDADAVTRRLDEVLDIVHAMPRRSCPPRSTTRSTICSAHRTHLDGRGSPRLPAAAERRRPPTPRSVRHPARRVLRREDTRRGDGKVAGSRRRGSHEAARDVPGSAGRMTTLRQYSSRDQRLAVHRRPG